MTLAAIFNICIVLPSLLPLPKFQHKLNTATGTVSSDVSDLYSH